MRIERRFTDADKGRYAGIEFRSTTSEIRNPDGSVVFKLEGMQVPSTWSQVAADVLADETGRFILQDNEDARVTAEHFIRPVFCLRAGRRFDADAVILPQPTLADAA